MLWVADENNQIVLQLNMARAAQAVLVQALACWQRPIALCPWCLYILQINMLLFIAYLSKDLELS